MTFDVTPSPQYEQPEEMPNTQANPVSPGRSFLSELLQTLLLAALLYFAIDAVFARVRVLNISMQPTLFEGNIVLVNKLAYKLGEMKTGDVVIFHDPHNRQEDFIKRLIGKPGDQVSVKNGEVYVNGNQLVEPYIASEPAYDGVWQVPDDSVGIAEIASGFNHKTEMTPLHAAWIAALILADGAAPVPWLVESAHTPDGETFYRQREGIPIRVLSPGTARDMQDLMEATIQLGTCRKSFRARRQDSSLRTVVFGGKTGNINNKTDTIKYDWFLGYGKTESGSHEIALSVIMVHGRLLGHRANVMAYDLFKRYFRQEKG